MKGLILAGGDGSRLGMEKALLNLHGESQVSYLCNQFRKCNIEPFVSVPGKKRDQFQQYDLIFDKPNISGPLAGIVAAFDFHPGPWLVFAVDMPFINSEVIEYLLKKRKPGMASCLTADNTNPEPLACIWEPESFKILQAYIAGGGNSASGFLKANGANLLMVKDPNWAKSINTIEDLEWARQCID